MVHMCQVFPLKYVDDRTFLKLFFRAYQNKKLNIDNPSSFNEKLQWLKLYDKNPEYTVLCDKYLVRAIVEQEIGEEHLIPLIGSWKSVDEIDIKSLPNQFVMKCNHDSGSVVICRDKQNFDWNSAKIKLKKSLKRNYFYKSREYNYKNIEPRIIAEAFMTDGDNEELTDYKIFCFKGVPRFIQVDIGRFSNHIRNFYTIDWEYIPVEYGCATSENVNIVKPAKLNEMLEYAKILSKDIPHVRVDFYVSNNQVYFGEYTFHHGGGAMKVSPYCYDLKWGNYIDISCVKKYKEIM